MPPRSPYSVRESGSACLRANPRHILSSARVPCCVTAQRPIPLANEPISVSTTHSNWPLDSPQLDPPHDRPLPPPHLALSPLASAIRLARPTPPPPPPPRCPGPAGRSAPEGSRAAGSAGGARAGDLLGLLDLRAGLARWCAASGACQGAVLGSGRVGREAFIRGVQERSSWESPLMPLSCFHNSWRALQFPEQYSRSLALPRTAGLSCFICRHIARRYVAPHTHKLRGPALPVHRIIAHSTRLPALHWSLHQPAVFPSPTFCSTLPTAARSVSCTSPPPASTCGADSSLPPPGVESGQRCSRFALSSFSLPQLWRR